MNIIFVIVITLFLTSISFSQMNPFDSLRMVNVPYNREMIKKTDLIKVEKSIIDLINSYRKSQGKNVLICIRDISPDEKNPFTAQQVYENILFNLSDLIIEERIKVQVIPDIESVNFGRGVGYDIIEHIPPVEIADISATKIREQMKAEGKLW